ncbi:TetR/AcrR family transcriptional regulator [Haloactinomyces albus]|uniref:AcrR family transcriptional regulator n=1 Tax=Haloactinomyces albus TaxID=1352928 RepID=A0AAE4CN47_9ACTN|nr:TetR/AcrR family transcriptional regulator [Haloactinomyces albus]MDR7301602.1 AcrR family transcriptional regulator [Haloactinomyces albus]
MAEAEEEHRAVGRPRSELARRAVLDSAYALLEDEGIDDFSIDAVSRRSGVARTTIYRRWPSKSVLAIDSFLECFRPQLDAARGGDPEENLRALVASLAAALAGPSGRVAASVVAHAQRDAETQRLFRERFSGPLRRESAIVLGAGVASGHFRADLDVERVIDAFVGAVYFRLLVGSSLDRSWVDALCDTLLIGCRARGGHDGGL